MRRSNNAIREYEVSPFELFVPELSVERQNTIAGTKIIESGHASTSDTKGPIMEVTAVFPAESTDTEKHPSPLSSSKGQKGSNIPIRPKDIQRLSALLENEIYENGIRNPSEIFFCELLKGNRLEALNAISVIFLSNYSTNTKKVGIAVGILHMLSHLYYEQVYPTGQFLALSAISHRDIELAEYGIKCFENWGNIDGIEKLKAVHFPTGWLQEYANQVICDLSEGS